MKASMKARLAAAWRLLVDPAEADQDDSIYWTQDLQAIIKSHRAKLPRFATVLEYLDIRPGMAILDVGAGTGQHSYIMAEKLQGAGRVIATDMSHVFVEYMKTQIAEKGLSNMDAVLVGGNLLHGSAIDEFYGRRRYDRILLHDVIASITSRPAFYRALAGRLTPQGRMVVVNTADDDTQPERFSQGMPEALPDPEVEQ